MNFIKSLLCTLIPSLFATLASRSTSILSAAVGMAWVRKLCISAGRGSVWHGQGIGNRGGGRRQEGVSLVPLVLGLLVTALAAFGAVTVYNSMTGSIDSQTASADLLNVVGQVEAHAAANGGYFCSASTTGTVCAGKKVTANTLFKTGNAPGTNVFNKAIGITDPVAPGATTAPTSLVMTYAFKSSNACNQTIKLAENINVLNGNDITCADEVMTFTVTP